MQAALHKDVKIWWAKYLTSGQLFQVCFPSHPSQPPFSAALSHALTIQILQFFTGMVVVAHSFYLGSCSGDKRTGVFSTVVNVSFFVLFLDFFGKKYNDGEKSPGKSNSSPKPSITTPKGDLPEAKKGK